MIWRLSKYLAVSDSAAELAEHALKPVTDSWNVLSHVNAQRDAFVNGDASLDVVAPQDTSGSRSITHCEVRVIWNSGTVAGATLVLLNLNGVGLGTIPVEVGNGSPFAFGFANWDNAIAGTAVRTVRLTAPTAGSVKVWMEGGVN